MFIFETKGHPSYTRIQRHKVTRNPLKAETNHTQYKNVDKIGCVGNYVSNRYGNYSYNQSKKVDDGDDELREIIDGVEGLVSGCDGNG